MEYPIHNYFGTIINQFRSSKEFSKRIIEKDYLFTKYTVPNAKISRFSPDAMELTAINENENAFKNKDDYKI